MRTDRIYIFRWVFFSCWIDIRSIFHFYFLYFKTLTFLFAFTFILYIFQFSFLISLQDFLILNILQTINLLSNTWQTIILIIFFNHSLKLLVIKLIRLIWLRLILSLKMYISWFYLFGIKRLFQRPRKYTLTHIKASLLMPGSLFLILILICNIIVYIVFTVV